MDLNMDLLSPGTKKAYIKEHASTQSSRTSMNYYLW